MNKIKVSSYLSCDIHFLCPSCDRLVDEKCIYSKDKAYLITMAFKECHGTGLGVNVICDKCKFEFVIDYIEY